MYFPSREIEDREKKPPRMRSLVHMCVVCYNEQLILHDQILSKWEEIQSIKLSPIKEYTFCSDPKYNLILALTKSLPYTLYAVHIELKSVEEQRKEETLEGASRSTGGFFDYISEVRLEITSESIDSMSCHIVEEQGLGQCLTLFILHPGGGELFRFPLSLLYPNSLIDKELLDPKELFDQETSGLRNMFQALVLCIYISVYIVSI